GGRGRVANFRSAAMGRGGAYPTARTSTPTSHHRGMPGGPGRAEDPPVWARARPARSAQDPCVITAAEPAPPTVDTHRPGRAPAGEDDREAEDEGADDGRDGREFASTELDDAEGVEGEDADALDGDDDEERGDPARVAPDPHVSEGTGDAEASPLHGEAECSADGKSGEDHEVYPCAQVRQIGPGAAAHAGRHRPGYPGTDERWRGAMGRRTTGVGCSSRQASITDTRRYTGGRRSGAAGASSVASWFPPGPVGRRATTLGSRTG